MTFIARVYYIHTDGELEPYDDSGICDTVGTAINGVLTYHLRDEYVIKLFKLEELSGKIEKKVVTKRVQTTEYVFVEDKQ